MNFRLHDHWPHQVRRDRWLLGVALVIVVSLLGRLFVLQIVGQERYSMISDDNRIEAIPLQAPRGVILDRNGDVLAESHPAYQIDVVPTRQTPMLRTVRDLGRLLQMDVLAVEEELKGRAPDEAGPVTVKSGASFAEVSLVEEHRGQLPGVEVRIETRRSYPFGRLACHVIGYVGEMTRDEAPRLSALGYLYGQMVGRMGIEGRYETLLSGVNGVEYIEVNAHGRKVGSFPDRFRKPRPGSTLWLTIDRRLQEAAEQAFPDSLSGCLVALDPYTGDVLASVSKPGFDPGIFAGGLTGNTWRKLREEKGNPLMNRVIQSAYPPGSTFKMVSAAAALELNLVGPFNAPFAACTGGMAFGNRVFRCWREGGHGSLNLEDAIAQSCDVYFYQLGRRLGLDAWSRYAALMGFGKGTRVDLNSEAAGLLPDAGYFNRRYGKDRWSGGVMLNLAIGQGEVLATPMQVARYTAALAAGGYLVQPHVLLKTDASAPDPPSARRIEELSASTLAAIRQSLLAVVDRGTGKQAQVGGVRVAGKTGTAQNPHGEPHAWFVGFAPFEHPRIVVATIIENAGHGGSVAAPVARKVIEAYLKDIPELAQTPIAAVQPLPSQQTQDQ